ncbi:hypothetical protein AGMMS49546_03770 [Spirochaetia bacterium]|nr:hypothetical protein AGMMS49546_03770 [Spirochaetia bacterium]
MNAVIKDASAGLLAFMRNRSRRRLLVLFLLGTFAFIEFMVLGLVRRTFVFYSINNWSIIVEDRMLRRSSNRELDIVRYVEEVLLGPVSPDLAPQFPRETRLRSLLYRNGVVYADLSESAALPPLEGGDVFRNFRTLDEGIRRNFSYVKDVRLFIAGNAAFYDEFQRIFSVERDK